MDKKRLKFIVPSTLGVFLFITPIVVGGEVTIPIAFLTKLIASFLKDATPVLALIIVGFSAFGGHLKIGKKERHTYLTNLLYPSKAWRIVRYVGFIFLFLAVFKIGGEAFWGATTGGLILNELFPILLAVFFIAGILLPLLLNFGLLEFVGAMMTKIMRPLFCLPGRSSINCIASWLGDGSIGILMANKEYQNGYYTDKEASIIGTTFSAVSITFSLVVIETVGLGHMFLPFYATVSIAGFITAILISRIPPLSRKKNSYYNNLPAREDEMMPKNMSSFSWGLYLAEKKADENKNISSFFIDGVKNVVDMWVGVLPIVMAVGTFSLILAEYTPLFQYLGLPFEPLLNILGVPEAKEASQTLVVGFADMFIPSILASAGISSEMTRFIIAGVSVSQLIYMSEVGGLLLGSKIPVSFWNLFVIFIERTLITLPIIVVMAKIFL